MEAAVAEKGAGMTEWNDDRLDEFRERVDDGFAKVDKRFERMEIKVDDGFANVDRRFEQIDLRFDALQRLLIRMAWTYGIGMLAFAAALLGLIAAKF
jgi:hypothetical protein